LAAVAVALLSGCQATYRAQVKSVRTLAQAGQFDLAAEKAAVGQGAYDKGDRVLALLDEGALLADAGKPKESNEKLLEAYDRLLEYYRKSAGTKAATSLVSSSSGDYLAEDHERVLLHLFTVQNFLTLGARDDALVEARRLTGRLGVLADVQGHGRRYRDDGLAQWLSGMLFEEDLDLSNALLSLKAATLAWKADPLLLAMACGDARRVAVKAKLPLEDLEACQALPPVEALETPLGPDQAEVILVHRAGLVPARNEVRRSCGSSGAGPVVCVTDDATRPAAVAKWAAVALPALEAPPLLLPQVALRVTSAGSDARAPGLLAEDVTQIVTQTFQDHLPEISTQATTRALARLGTSAAAGVGAGVLAAHEQSKPDAKQAQPEKGADKKAEPKQAPPPPPPAKASGSDNAVLIGLAVATISQVVLSETEHADTRTWATLPARFNVARLRVPAGKQHVLAELLDAQGKPVRTVDLGELDLIGGQRRWLQVRSAE
jgi:hypothetical protein